MKNIYFVQVGFEFDGSVYLPYAAGTIIAYCKNDKEICKEYCFADIIFKREKIECAMNKIKQPHIVAFSCSVWNMEYNKTLAAKIKKLYPDCKIIFGGHSVCENAELLRTESYIDILMFGEGEATFAELLKQLNFGNFSSVKNIAYRHNNDIIKTDDSGCGDISDYPSPYLSGVFDKIMLENKGTDFLAVLETNRGCPYSCAYCDWCAGKKMRFFPLKKILGEIKWLSENKIEYCFCADSNFGMFERDINIAKALVEAKQTTGYPKVFRPCYEKNSDERVFEICNLLNKNGMDKGATMAYQTLSDCALGNIGRKNLTLEHFSSLMKKYNEAGISTYSELILGLPGETRESFCKGICKLFENGQHNSVSVYHCEVLPNSLLATPKYIEQHRIETIKVAFNHIHSAPMKDEEVKEYSYLVRSTATLSREDWVYANLFSVCVQCFHSLGLLRFFAMHLYNTGIIGYYEFYTALLSFIMNGSGLLSGLWNSFKAKYETSLAGDWNHHNDLFGNITWFFEEGAFLEAVSNSDAYYAELEEFLKQYVTDKDIYKQLMIFQQAMVKKPFDKPAQISLDYDFYDYFRRIINSEKPRLEKKHNTIFINPNTSYGYKQYAKEVVWFGRRRGATVYNSSEIVKGK